MRKSDDAANIIRPTRRKPLLGTSALVAATSLTSNAFAQAQKAAAI
jgi:hypothetical protein